ncbi:enoyl-CoA hydratase/isomerase family protein [Sphingobium yanoikuyae]|uniref:enoyl-CoA hydratase/isomerase family protein n=1 Tax=Sphingobium yanoikuyae TaxID=13690 RepID=UPI0022DE209D|nr:enoyl-CoA hydratase/isomerase family protein [Sphingobium yanoikuyae]WBQ15240.1 enoyl-CoA hydratase/isomerase family protein [Sphingobium yanoikuyae]
MTDDVLIAVEGGVGRLRLNRPKAIHALTRAMCATMTDALLAWQDDVAIRVVMIDHAEGRGFCAGGDIRLIAESAAGDNLAARDFFATEYRLNHLLFTYGKPVIAFMDGITMGGGVGIAQPARYRVATERTVYAMPETGIGLFPDVGGGWYLSRLPGRSGRYLAVTGARIDGADAIALGLATDYVPSDRLEEAKAAIIADPSDIGAALARYAVTPPDSHFAARLPDIDRLFASDRLEDIYAALRADRSDWAQAQLAALDTKSPQTMKVALRQLAQASRLTRFVNNMAMEYDLACRIIARPDIVEGVRALIVDKDNQPRWNPPTVEAVTDQLVDAIFAPLPEGERWTPLPQAAVDA